MPADDDQASQPVQSHADVDIRVVSDPAAGDLATIGEGLTSFNEGEVGPANRLPLAVLVRNSDGRLVGGISGHTAWGWLYVQWLWLDAGYRGRGLAGAMLEAAETEARARGCHGSYIDTFNPVALKAYRRAGYVPFGELPDFPRGRTRTFLSKAL
ncbi:MAG: GNAT family N-acetyltransferase [Devosia sp.]